MGEENQYQKQSPTPIEVAFEIPKMVGEYAKGVGKNLSNYFRKDEARDFIKYLTPFLGWGFLAPVALPTSIRGVLNHIKNIRENPPKGYDYSANGGTMLDWFSMIVGAVGGIDVLVYLNVPAKYALYAQLTSLAYELARGAKRRIINKRNQQRSLEDNIIKLE